MGQQRDDTYKNDQVFWKNEYKVLCQYSNWSKLFSGIMPLFFPEGTQYPKGIFIESITVDCGKRIILELLTKIIKLVVKKL